MVRKELAISAARWMSEQLSEGGSRDGNFCSTRGYPAQPDKEQGWVWVLKKKKPEASSGFVKNHALTQTRPDPFIL